ncbi:MAG: universal stress protein [Nitrospirota bacterium]
MTTQLVTRILFATDLSDCAARAQAYATYLATAWEAKIDVLHVVEGPKWLTTNVAALPLTEEVRKEAATRLDEVQGHMARNGITVSVRQVMGIPNEQIDLVARENGVDLVVLGTQGRENVLYGLIGSTAERVIKGAPCPVLAVPGYREGAHPLATEAQLQIPIQHILAPVDFSSPSLDALEYAIQLANRLGTTITLMHVLEPICYDLDYSLGSIEHEVRKRDHWKSQLTELSDLVKSFGLPADFQVSGGVPSDAILVGALQGRSDLIVMGTHGRRGLSQKRFGSVAEAVLRRATCPVLTVKTPKFAPGHRRVVPQAMAES